MVQQVKNLRAVPETKEMQFHSLGREDALEEETAACSSVLACNWAHKEWELNGNLLFL